ncbi:hypothetical protein Acr_23g0010990 [Actinidia rufa]|uniref:RNase H type-1 domain-containing protein n=1 Tax=Actinidia rufa TaxID=165716 RepID=A0A7J0GQ19_9ERIC|nr:hypothetical protein Acr_23g0010990 [Actinidia rufa]
MLLQTLILAEKMLLMQFGLCLRRMKIQEKLNEEEYLNWSAINSKDQVLQVHTKAQADQRIGNSTDNRTGDLIGDSRNEADIINSLKGISSYEEVIEHLVQQLHKIEAELVIVLRVSTFVVTYLVAEVQCQGIGAISTVGLLSRLLPQKFGAACGNDNSQLSMHLRSHLLPRPSASSPLDNKSHPMANTSQAPDLEGLYHEIHDEVMYKAFYATLKGSARSLFRKLPPSTVDSFGYLSRLFVANFMSYRTRQKNAFHLFIVHQKEIESKADKYIAAKQLAEAKRRRRGRDDQKRKEPEARRFDYKDEAKSRRTDRDHRKLNNMRPRTLPRRPDLILPYLNAPIAQGGVPGIDLVVAIHKCSGREKGPHEVEVQKEQDPNEDLARWRLFVDGSSNQHGCDAGLVLQTPSGEHMEYAICIGSRATNNEAEYEALLTN